MYSWSYFIIRFIGISFVLFVVHGIMVSLPCGPVSTPIFSFCAIILFCIVPYAIKVRIQWDMFVIRKAVERDEYNRLIPPKIQRVIKRLETEVRERTGDDIIVILEDVAKKKHLYPEKYLVEELEKVASDYVNLVGRRRV